MLQYADIAGYPLAYAQAGTAGPALVLIHGSMSDYRSWVNQMAPFSASFRTIAVSLRHCYPEKWDGTGDDFSVEQHASDVAALIEAMDIGPAHVVGHSRGGAVAMQLVLQRPDLVRALVLGDPGGFDDLLPDTPEGRSMAAESARIFEQLREDLATTDAETAARHFSDALSGPGAWARRPQASRQVMLDNLRTGPASAQRPQFTLAQIASVRAPVLAITGSASPPRYRTILETMRRANGNVSPLVEIADAAHSMQRDNAATFNAAVLEFLARH